jgi:phosphocarrier protein HPr
MTRNEYLIIDPHGMHARPAAALLKLSRQFTSEITISKADKKVQLKSMLNILALALKHNDTIVLEINGDDEVAAAATLDHFFREEMKNF